MVTPGGGAAWSVCGGADMVCGGTTDRGVMVGAWLFWMDLPVSCCGELVTAASGPADAADGVGGQDAEEEEEVGSPTDGDRAVLGLCETVEGADPAPLDSAFPVDTLGEEVCALTIVAARTCDEFAFQRFWRASALHAAHRQLPWQAGQI